MYFAPVCNDFEFCEFNSWIDHRIEAGRSVIGVDLDLAGDLAHLWHLFMQSENTFSPLLSPDYSPSCPFFRVIDREAHYRSARVIETEHNARGEVTLVQLARRNARRDSELDGRAEQNSFRSQSP